MITEKRRLSKKLKAEIYNNIKDFVTKKYNKTSATNELKLAIGKIFYKLRKEATGIYPTKDMNVLKKYKLGKEIKEMFLFRV